MLRKKAQKYGTNSLSGLTLDQELMVSSGPEQQHQREDENPIKLASENREKAPGGRVSRFNCVENIKINLLLRKEE